MGEETRAKTGTALAAAGSILLIVSLVLDWYQLELPTEGGREREGPSFNAWDSLERSDTYLVILAVAALVGVVVLLGNWIRDSNAAQITVLLVGLAALFLVLYRGLNPPKRVIFGVELDSSLEIGWYVALLSSLLMAVGGGLTITPRPAAESGPEEAEPRAEGPRSGPESTQPDA